MNPDGALPLVRRQLADAVSSMVDPIPVRVGDRYRWSPALYGALRTELSGGKPLYRGGSTLRRSRAPLRLDVLALLIEIDETAARWDSDEKNTVERLRAIAARSWRPQDTAMLEHFVDDLRRWVVTGAELLTPEPRVYLPMPCPRCEARHAYHRNGYGESVSSAALKLSESGCACLSCGAWWPPSQFDWLAKLLGC